MNESISHLAAPCVVPELELIQAFSFPTEAPSSFELPDSGVLELTFAANRPVLPPAWKDGHVEAAIQKVRERLARMRKRLTYRKRRVARWTRKQQAGGM